LADLKAQAEKKGHKKRMIGARFLDVAKRSEPEKTASVLPAQLHKQVETVTG